MHKPVDSHLDNSRFSTDATSPRQVVVFSKELIPRQRAQPCAAHKLLIIKGKPDLSTQKRLLYHHHQFETLVLA
jgi:hypothetical protein